MDFNGAIDQEQAALRILAQAEKRVQRDILRHEQLMEDLRTARKAYLNLVDELLQLHGQHARVQGEIEKFKKRIREARRPQIASLAALRASDIAISSEEVKTRAKDKGANLCD
jgi:predicted  nucleic acid-binding Zn-ribbon protein